MAGLKTIGGDRLGSGKKMKVGMHAYEMSTHNLGYIFRSSGAFGTLIPFMSKVGLPNSTHDINLNTVIKTLPTIAPMFGSAKVQLDVFRVPMRLYIGQVHNNKLNIGNNMSVVKLPRLKIEGESVKYSLNDIIPVDVQQHDQSSLLSYLGIRGYGRGDGENEVLTRYFNAIPFLAYWDIYKCYYANKQEEIGMMIHSSTGDLNRWYTLKNTYIDGSVVNINEGSGNTVDWDNGGSNVWQAIIKVDKGAAGTNGINILVLTTNNDELPLNYFWDLIHVETIGEYDYITCEEFKSAPVINETVIGFKFTNKKRLDGSIQIVPFSLSNIDLMREDILAYTKNNNPFTIDKNTYAPYGLPLHVAVNGWTASQFTQEGLALKTYQSDMNNNWISTEWIDGDNGISKVTAISTVDDYFTLDTLNLSKKVYNMLNRIAISGGSYQDWMEAVYDTRPYDRAESPVYEGGLSKELVFQELVSSVESADKPQGNLAGKGTLSDKHKGGHVYIKCDEPSYIIGIISVTPRIDYSQANSWDTELRTLDDLHKPALDEIGFQDLITDTNMAFWDYNPNNGHMSAGKQPAWINYQTAVNQVYGNFADSRKEMYMTMNRRYEMGDEGHIADLTTYIDPSKFNYMFAQQSLDAQNLWIQIAVDYEARMKMSAKIMPNL